MPEAHELPTVKATWPDKAVLVTIGWTNSDPVTGYSSFSGYRPGADQHTETVAFAVPYDYSDEDVCWALLEATNAPHVRDGSPAAAALAAITATGYRGAGSHYSLSVGDTVTIHSSEAGPDGAGVQYAFTGLAVERVQN